MDARRLRENNQQKCRDSVKPRSNKIEIECKKCDCNEIEHDYQNSSYLILSSL